MMSLFLISSGGNRQPHHLRNRLGNRKAAFPHSLNAQFNPFAQQLLSFREACGRNAKPRQVGSIGALPVRCFLEDCRVFLHFKPAC